MKELKHFASRFSILFTFIGLLIAYNSCISDQKDKDLLSIQTFLEQHDGSTWTVIEDDMRIYLRLNDDNDKGFELWMSELELAKLMVHKECFYYSKEMLDIEGIKVLENTGSKLEFTHLDDETWTFSMDGERLRMEFKALNNATQAVYFSSTNENVDKLDICPDKRDHAAFEWKFLK